MDRRQFVGSSLLGAGAMALPGLARAEGETLAVTIRSRDRVGALPHIWEECVGSDRAAITMRESWRKDMALARQELGTKRVRFHGILNDELGVYNPTIVNRDGAMNFRNVAAVYDGVVDLGLSPLIELSMMPGKLASGKAAFGFYQGNITPPTSYDEWGRFIGEFGRFLVNRYGLAKVANWPIEVWNEPDLPFFWTGDQAGYLKLYKAAAVALKSIHPSLTVGGPATSGTKWISEFLDFCKVENAPVDFVSTHVYAGDDTKRLFGKAMDISINDVVPMAVKNARTKIAQSAFSKLPLYLDEWASDSPAMIAHILSNVLEDTQMMSHWVLSGSYEELGVPDYLLAEGSMGYPLMLDRIPRPTYNTYRLLHALGNTRVAADGPALASRREDGKLAALVWNLAEVAQPGGIPGSVKTRKVVGTAKRIAVTLADMAPGQRLKVTYVDQVRGSPFPAWRAMGSPKIPSQEQVRSLRQSAQLSQPQLVRLDRSRQVSLDLPAEGVALIESV